MIYKPPVVIAEIGCNHLGDMKLAEKQVNLAIDFADIDIIKFQKRCNKELLTVEQQNAPHPNQHYSYGSTYLEHREFLELNVEQHKHLKEYIENKDKVYSTSVWDLTSTKEIVSLNPKLIKIPSASNMNFKIHEYLCNNYEGEVHISFGMTYQKEEDEIVDFYTKHNKNNSLVLYNCISGYPVAFEYMYLLELERLINKFKGSVKDFGFSGHHLGISVDVAAYTLGATYIERHFVHDRTIRHTDASASLEPDGMRKLKRDLLATYEALKNKPEEIIEIEKVQRNKLKRVIK